MALVQFGGGVAQIRGKLGGTIFSRNRGGSFVRTFVTPTNPNTPAQQQVRNALSTLVVKWLTVLTQLQRDGWETYADNVPMQNGLGDTIFLTGQQMFIRSNSVLIRNEKARVDDAPTIFNLGEFTPVVFSAVTTPFPQIFVNFTFADDWVTEIGAFMFVQGSRQMNPTINFFKGPFLQIGAVIGNDAPPPFPPLVVAVPFTYTPDNRTFIRVRVIRADGRLSSAQIATTIIVT